jgi:hypothetical protein
MDFPRSILPIGVVLAASLCASTSHAQPDFLMNAAPAAPDPAIVRALLAIQAGSIERTIQTMAGLGTRSTLSRPEKDLPPAQGASPAADWIAGQFEQISHDCGGCLEVRRDTFTVPISKNSVIFGVRAVDAAGHRCLVVFP